MLMSVVQVHLSPPYSGPTGWLAASSLWGFVDCGAASAPTARLLALRRFFNDSLWTNTMNRCTALLFSFLLAGAALAPAAAQTDGERLPARSFPPQTARGVLTMLAAPEIQLNGQADRLSPAARIQGIDNALVLPGALAGQKMVVNYLRDNTGLVRQVWILSADEARQKLAAGAPGAPGEGGFFSKLRSMWGDKPAADDGSTPYEQLPRYK
jgi:hypothetical protein